MDTPGLLVSPNGAALLLGKENFIVLKDNEMVKAIVALLASFYLLDLDYPLGSMISLSILQRIVFGDNTVHPDFKDHLIKAWNDLEEFCSGDS